jgi:cob(I)alamin adenosyltransferase
MVQLDKIVTKAGDRGQTRLATGEQVLKNDARVAAYGAIDEANSVIGVARLYTSGDGLLDAILARLQNDLFDLGADLATPERDDLKFQPLRIQERQTQRLETEIEDLNAQLAPLTSFILPGGAPAAAHLHLARATMRRAERAIVELSQTQTISPEALRYANRTSDLLFVAARWANAKGDRDILWKPGGTR